MHLIGQTCGLENHTLHSPAQILLKHEPDTIPHICHWAFTAYMVSPFTASLMPAQTVRQQCKWQMLWRFTESSTSAQIAAGGSLPWGWSCIDREKKCCIACCTALLHLVHSRHRLSTYICKGNIWWSLEELYVDRSLPIFAGLNLKGTKAHLSF